MFGYMAYTSKLHFLVFQLLLLLPNYGAHGVRRMPCYFIFGDSLADNGNNNDLNTTAKVNYPPYGIDFPCGPTGRFTNGRTTVDIIAQLLGFSKFIPPFATAKGKEILEGVNYASGGSGIRDETGQILGEHICLNAQLKNHGTTISRMTEILGNDQNQTTDLLNKCLYTLEIGSNDFINNYFMPKFYDTSKTYTAEQYANILIRQYSQQLTTLYNYGARKISLFGVGPVGCTPFAINSFGTNGSLCVDKMNVAVQIFNDQLKLLVDQLNCKLTDAKFIFIDILGMSTKITKSIPVVSGANGLSTAFCCQVNQFGVCTPLTRPCPNRSLSLFWDAFHPTEAANLITAIRSYSAINPSDVHPTDINGLSQL